MRLALAMGIPPRELARRLTARELAEFEELYRMDPWGPERMDLGFGIVAATLANCHRDPKKGRPFRPTDFMSYLDPDERRRIEQTELAGKIKSALKPTRKKAERRSG